METQAEPKGRSGKRAAVAIIGLLVLFALVAAALHVKAGYEKFQRDLTTLDGVTVGSPMNEVRYAMGEPQTVLGAEVDDPKAKGFRLSYNVKDTTGPSVMPKGMTYEQSDTWIWERGQHTLAVEFDKAGGNVKSINCFVPIEKHIAYECTTIGGVYIDEPEDQIVAKLGKPDKETYDSDNPSKTFNYQSLGLIIGLSKRSADQFGKTAPKDVGFGYWLTHGMP